MLGNAPRELPQLFGFILVPDFSMMAVTAAIEAMRQANRLSGRELYGWRLYTADGAPIRASNGFFLPIDGDLEAASSLDTIAVCGGLQIHLQDTSRLCPWLRKMARRGADIGAICTGSHILAKCGLLDGYTCTIHWENLAALVEQFPEIQVTNELFEIDRIENAEIRRLETMSLPARLGVRHPKLLSVVKQMEDNLEEPLARSELAEAAGLSTRQLERLFRKYLQRSPARFYLELRLNRARLLLLQTNMSVIDVALACGFVSASHFSKCYRDFFGHTPRKERGMPGGEASGELSDDAQSAVG